MVTIMVNTYTGAVLETHFVKLRSWDTGQAVRVLASFPFDLLPCLDLAVCGGRTFFCRNVLDDHGSDDGQNQNQEEEFPHLEASV